tara:strand:+ start:520 stop:903 length:384 start_codon:yes stop_codon:yes gene_type:complete
MSDILNIRVTEAELDLITLLLEQAGTMEDSNGQPAFELLHDLMEQAARPGDWTEDLEPTEIEEGRTFTVAESDFIDHGIRAREMQKATSMAADRRIQRFGEFSVETPDGRSDQQKVDVWDANDPTNW